ncbi:hypothetical protein Bca52824_039751 [Brassica carinata]|uniref:Serine-threonine/tyrosine-protein kinase catalytic domain-containing protein n=1 Tax=Brassica carinata TaxID=52824 RepID=A0A8X7RS33_BRACI|nr:hypothetical protein Bca52824_039751 [Brassica carinata]
MAEWSLKDIRHRNLVKLLTACSSLDFQGNEFRALVYEFMPNGSLDIWLHPEKAEAIHRPSRTLTLLERLNIAIDNMDWEDSHQYMVIKRPTNELFGGNISLHSYTKSALPELKEYWTLQTNR